MKKIICILLLLTIAYVVPVKAAFTYKPVTATIPVHVENANSTSIVTIVADEDSPSPEVSQKKPDVDGNLAFSITYDEPGNYDYKISQSQSENGVVTDETIYQIRIFITNNENTNELMSQVMVYLEQQDEKPAEVRFINTIPTTTEEKETTTEEKGTTEKTTATKTNTGRSNYGNNNSGSNYGSNNQTGTNTGTRTNNNQSIISKVKTGDYSPFYIYIAVALLALVLLAIKHFLFKEKENNQEE